ncbi:hypothetical protein [Nocardioides sp. YIM 152315]|uniref:hypothetical protein n=1 Tax=Nocardioides sp. YIM 152315 TaxID=3031760 RepID=UPI0023DABC68|nr:hypothetical protein [Nocardioides sp. YIM 152315]MDF1602766.1 hypothetical protein [Nocardioides sp. YIM 152315]
MNDDLTFQNDVVLALVQALLGSIPASVEAIAVETSRAERRVDIHVALDPGRPAGDFMEEVIFDLDALTGGDLIIRSSVWSGPDWRQGWPGVDKRMVYAAAR